MPVIYHGSGMVPEMATILFYDMGNARRDPIGTLTVPKYTDVRKIVNEYVRMHFIHPDLRHNGNTASLARIDNYRGKYPAEGPAPDGTVSETTRDENHAQPGSRYPLTSHLDYAFFKRELALDNPANPTKWVQVVHDTPDPYPYIRGWATGVVWSVMGTYELNDYDSKTGSLPIRGDDYYLGSDIYFKQADFSSVSEDKLEVTAIYEPGAGLRGLMPFRNVETVKFRSHLMDGSSFNGLYKTNLSYERVYVQQDNGNVAGTTCVRSPSIQVAHRREILRFGVPIRKLNERYREVVTSGIDIVQAEVMLPHDEVEISYQLVDAANGLTFMTGSKRSNSGHEIDSFDYDHYAWGEHKGSDGFVLRGTLGTFLEEFSKSLRGERSRPYIMYYQLEDMNWKADMNGAKLETYYAEKYLRQLVSLALGPNSQPGEVANLTWHQIQYYIIHQEYVSAEVAQAEKYPWCRLMDGCETLTEIITLPALLTAAQAGNLSGLWLSSAEGVPFYLWQVGDAGTPASCVAYEDLATLRADIIAAVQGVPGDFDYTALTLGQLQYHLIHKDYPSDMATAQAEADTTYWWQTGKGKVSNWTELVYAARLAQGGVTSLLSTLPLEKVGNDPYYLRADKAGTAFSSVEAFQTAIAGAVGALPPDPVWRDVQLKIVDPEGTGAALWWDHGGKNLAQAYADESAAMADLITNLKLAEQGYLVPLASLTWTVASAKPFDFRKNFAGEIFDGETDEAKLAAMNTLLMEAASGGTADWGNSYAWHIFQYYIVHGAFDPAVDRHAMYYESSGFYWWKGKRSPSEPYYYSAIVEAAFYAERNGYSHNLNLLSASGLSNAQLAKGTPSTAKLFEELDKYTTDEELVGARETLRSMIRTYIQDFGGDPYKIPTFTRYQVQHYLITGQYALADSPEIGMKVYWWFEYRCNPTMPSPFGTLLDGMLAHATGDSGYINGLFLLQVGSVLRFRSTNDGAGFNPRTTIQIARPRLKALSELAYNGGVAGPHYDGTKLTLSWYQVQFYLINDTLDGYPAEVNPSYAWPPMWAKDRFGLPGGEPQSPGLEGP